MEQNLWKGSIWGVGGESLPPNLLYLSGSIKDEAVDWEAGATCVTVLEMNVDSSAVTGPTNVSGGLYATATGLEFRDGTNVSLLPCTWNTDDTLVVALEVAADGTMIIKRMES